MITDLVLLSIGGLASLVLEFFPVVQPPAFLGEIPGWLSSLLVGAGSLGVWFPLGRLPVALGIVGVALVVAATIKIVRIVASFFTLGGGSAA